MRAYAIEVMGEDKPTHVSKEDLVKFLKAASAGMKMIYVGGDFINPSSVKRIRVAWDVDASELVEADQEMLQLLGDNKLLT